MQFVPGPPRDLAQFWKLIVALTIAGFALAIAADGPWVDGGPFWQALREIGGALVAGAVIAGLVVWFEQHRDDQREDEAEDRAAEAAQRAWQFEMDMRIISMVNGELSTVRRDWRDVLEQQTLRRSASNRHAEENAKRKFDETSEMFFNLVLRRRSGPLWDEVRAWRAEVGNHRNCPPPATTGSIAIGVALASRDPSAHLVLVVNEHDAWINFMRAVAMCFDTQYQMEE